MTNVISSIKTFLSSTVKLIKENEQLAGLKELTGAQKKDRLDAFMVDKFEAIWDDLKLPVYLKLPIVNSLIKKNIKKVIPQITQMIYDLVKTRIEGVTSSI